MSDRGSYRSVATALLNGPDFQGLSRDARFTFLALKLNFGVVGIEVWYPAELVARVSAQTGIAAGGVQSALNELEAAGWIEREANIVWLIGQLRYDPHVKPADRKHRKMVQTQIDGLPRLDIVTRFVLAHAQWFTEDGTPSGAPNEILSRAYEAPEKGLRSMEKEKEEEKELLVPSGDGTAGTIRPSSEYPADFLALWAMYPKRHGGNSKREAFLAWRARLREGVTAEVLHAGVVRYLGHCKAAGKIGSPYVMMTATFLGPGERYLEPWDAEPAPAVDASPRVLRATEMLL